MFTFGRVCLNWRVLLALGGVGLFIWVVAPGLILKLLPFLVLAVCPLSMLLMPWAMRRGMDRVRHTQPVQVGPSTAPGLEAGKRLAELQAKQSALGREIAEVKAEVERQGNDRQAAAKAKEG